MFTLSGMLGIKATAFNKKASSTNKSTPAQKSIQREIPSVNVQKKLPYHPYATLGCFTKSFNSATELSDGSKLLRPVCTQLGVIDIKPTKENQKYKISITPPHFSKDQKPITQTLNEKEILENRILSRGKIKKGSAPDTYIIEYKDNQGRIRNIEASENECLVFLQQNSLCM